MEYPDPTFKKKNLKLKTSQVQWLTLMIQSWKMETGRPLGFTDQPL